MRINYNLKVEDLNMSKRTTDALINNNIRYLADLRNITQEDMIHWRNFGTMSKRELIHKLREFKIEII